jgi:serine/threonine protein phosphatase PrpC
MKGVALALADGISTSPVSQVAAETAVKTFLADYYCTSEAWAVRTAGCSVIASINAWLHNETVYGHAAYDRDRGYVCTFSVLIAKGRLAHIFHVGDARVSRVDGDSLEPLTREHRIVLSEEQGYLARALGIDESVEVDYAQCPLVEGDVYVLATDGVHQFVAPRELVAMIRRGADLDDVAKQIVQHALSRGGDDNLTVQILCVESLPDEDPLQYSGQLTLPPPPIPEPPAELDGYRLLRQIHASGRSHIFLAADPENGAQVALKLPAASLREHEALLRQFMMEEWIARRVSSPHLLKMCVAQRPRRFLYVVSEYINGQSLRQWMHDHPRPDLHSVREIIEQMVRGVRALHRKEMVHGDLRPENVMIDADGTVKIIDFGSVRVAGLVEAAAGPEANPMLGAVQYAAPEWLAGEVPTWRSDLFSVAVIAYEMLTGSLPYGAAAARVRTRREQLALQYDSARSATNPVPDWMDGALRMALHPDPLKRYESMSEFVQDLKVPNRRFQRQRNAPLLERDPVLFWKVLSLLLMLVIVVMLTVGH